MVCSTRYPSALVRFPVVMVTSYGSQPHAQAGDSNPKEEPVSLKDLGFLSRMLTSELSNQGHQTNPFLIPWEQEQRGQTMKREGRTPRSCDLLGTTAQRGSAACQNTTS